MRRTEVRGLLIGIERELRRLDLWESRPPPPHALMSEQPFCFDTLTFTQWLQWVFIVRVDELLANDRPLPAQSDIHPLAEHVFAEHDYDSAALLELIRRFDEIVTHGDDATHRNGADR